MDLIKRLIEGNNQSENLIIITKCQVFNSKSTAIAVPNSELDKLYYILHILTCVLRIALYDLIATGYLKAIIKITIPVLFQYYSSII